MEWLKQWIVWAIDFLSSWAYTLGSTLFEELLDLIPADAMPDIWSNGKIEATYYWLNAWVPIPEIFGLQVTIITTRFVILSIKWFLKIVRGS